ncbi:retrovirus-related pol polyprotein from transposon TNT 1-94 [Tanacetum coccineum]
MKGIRKINNTYHYKGRTVVGTVAAITDGDRNLKAVKLWHMRLGHAGEKSLNLLIKQGLIKGLSSCKLDLCENCINGKTTRVKFRIDIHKTQGILDYVHSDVWGPSKTRSLGGRHYYVTFVDDFSRRVWMYTLKTKDEYGKPASYYDSLHVFGSAAYYHVKESKLDPRAKKALFMRITSGIKGYHLWCPETKKTIFSRDVTFNESAMLKKVNIEKLDGTPTKKVEFEGIIVPADIETNDNSPMVEGDYEEEEVQAEEPRQQQHESIATSKPKRNTKRPARLNDTMTYASSIAADDVPTTYSEAVRDSENENWRIAMSKKMQSLQKNHTWELTNLPEGKKAIGCKWVYAKKEGFPGQDDVCYEASLVAKGYAQKERIDYNEVFSPVTTFLLGDLEEEIYMVQLEGFKVAGKAHEVYDMLIASQSLDEIEKLKTQLKSEFEMKDLGEAKMILGMEIVRDRKLRKLCLTQKQYLRRVLKRFRFGKQTKRVSTPLASQFKISAAMSSKNDAERAYMEKVTYANVVGSLMYAMICTRPDISHDVGMVEGYCDSDYDRDLDKRRAMTGYVFTLAKAPVSWKSTLQSTTEAEYMAMTEAVKEAIWLQGLFGELGISQKFVMMHSDSQSAIHLAKNQVYHARTKHIDVRSWDQVQLLFGLDQCCEKLKVGLKTPPKMVNGKIDELIFAKIWKIYKDLATWEYGKLEQVSIKLIFI